MTQEQWPLVAELVRAECDAYILDARDDATWVQPTRCPPWTVLDLTRHLAATFHRYVELLRRTRAGETRAPFTPDELGEENLRAVREFAGDPHDTLCEEVARFASLAGDPAEPILNQRGTVPVGLQMRWGLNELAVHHDDLAQAVGRAYRPPDAVIDAIVPAYEPLGRGAPDAGEDRWAWILRATGRRGRVPAAPRRSTSMMRRATFALVLAATLASTPPSGAATVYIATFETTFYTCGAWCSGFDSASFWEYREVSGGVVVTREASVHIVAIKCPPAGGCVWTNWYGTPGPEVYQDAQSGEIRFGTIVVRDEEGATCRVHVYSQQPSEPTRTSRGASFTGGQASLYAQESGRSTYESVIESRDCGWFAQGGGTPNTTHDFSRTVYAVAP